jgi:TPR repeat protein
MKLLKIVLGICAGTLISISSKGGDNQSLSITNQETALKLIQDTEKLQFPLKRVNDYKKAYEILKKELSETNSLSLASLFFLAQAQNQYDYSQKNKQEYCDSLRESLENIRKFEIDAANKPELQEKLKIVKSICGDIYLKLGQYKEAEKIYLSLLSDESIPANRKNLIENSLCLLYSKNGDDKNEAIYEKRLGYYTRKRKIDVLPNGDLDIKKTWNSDVQGLLEFSTREKCFQSILENSIKKESAFHLRGPIKDIVACKQLEGDPIFLIFCRTTRNSKENGQEFKGPLFIVKANGEMIEYSKNFLQEKDFIGDVLNNGSVQMLSAISRRLKNGKKISDGVLIQIDDNLTPLFVAYSLTQKDPKFQNGGNKNIEYYEDSQKVANIYYDQTWVSDNKGLNIVNIDINQLKKKYPNDNSESLIWRVLEEEKALGPNKNLEELVEIGDLDAMYSLGDELISVNMHYRSREDEKKGFELLEKAAKRGSAKASLRLGQYFANDEVTALKWYVLAEMQEECGAEDQIAQIFINGNGEIKFNDDIYKDAFQALLKAANKGKANTKVAVGICYYNGNSVPRNESEGFRWMNIAADSGSGFAARFLGESFIDGSAGASKDDKEAFKWFMKAAESDSSGQSFVGDCYMDGIGVEEDPKEAVNWYHKAAASGNPTSRLGDCYLNGFGVSKDEKEAFKYYLEASSCDTWAEYMVGRCYQDGIGVIKNDSESQKWLNKANDGAKMSLEWINKTHKTPEQVDHQLAFWIGRIYLNGIGVQKNENDAIKWFSKAAKNGNRRAQKELQNLQKSKLSQSTTNPQQNP